MPASIEPMKATLADQPPRGDEWLFEVKWDGVRAIAFIDHEEVRLQSRSGTALRAAVSGAGRHPPPHRRRAARFSTARSPCSTRRASRSFHLIQPRIANTDPNTVAHLVRSTPVVYFVFDLLYLDGYDLRRWTSRSAASCSKQVRHARPGAAHLRRVSRRRRRRCWKRRARTASKASSPSTPRSCYESRRSREWLKIKIVSEQEFVIGGFTEPQGDRDYFGALVLGVYEDGKLRWVGNVGTGFDQKTLASLYAKLQPLIIAEVPVRRASQARPRDDVGAARTGLPGEIRQLDAGRPAARARVSGPARRRAAPRGARRSEPTRCTAPSPELADGAKEVDGRDRRPHAEVHQPEEGLLSRRRLHQARRPQLLRRGRGR